MRYAWRRSLLPVTADNAQDRTRFEHRLQSHRSSLAEEMREAPVVVVLGEGGCGKSVALDQEHAQLDAAGLPVTWLDLGRDVFDLATAGTRLHQDLRTGLDERARFLLLDGLDEGLRDIPGLERALLHHLGSPSEQERRGPRLRITCRTTRWPEGLDRGLRALWPLAGQVATMTLAPLPRSDIQLAVEQHGLDGGTFVAQVVGRGLEALAQQPVTLTWFGARGRSGMVYRSRMRNQGFGHEMFDGRPVIGIATRASELAPCNAHLTRVAEAVKCGVWRAGGLPLPFPTMATGGTLMRSHRRAVPQPHGHGGRRADPADPLDGVLLLSGCDKTTPAMLVGAASVDLPAVLVTGVPMLNGKYRGQDVGSGTHVWKCEEDLKIGRMTEEEYFFAEGCMARSEGHCMTMGTASTMACVAEALGMQLPGSAAWPAVDSRQMGTAQAAGQRIVRMVGEELCPSRILTREAFENAIRVNAAIGGSTNAVIHLTAIAGRVGVEQGLQDFDDSVRAVPTLVNLMPSGTYLMEDFCYAGGLPAVMAELLSGRLLHGEQITVTGRTIAENTENTEKAERVDSDVITGLDASFLSAGTGIADLRGNLCPDGAVIKQSAASPHLLTHRGPARVFDSPEAHHEVADDPELDIDENTVIVIGNAGPMGYPGMPEVANVPLPAKLLKAGVKDMVRVCDGRMSGTGYGTVVLHVAPEAAVGGPLALVHDGDPVVLDVPNRFLRLDVDDTELTRRRQTWKAPAEPHTNGYAWLCTQNVEQADQGADFGFLRGSRGHEVPRDSH